MAGILPPKKSSGRKQWTIHDGPRGSLRQLRNQLANDGCPESQVVLAKELLEDGSELEIDQKENARLGVYWLIKASEQGNSEATELLGNCLVTGRGITEHNFLDVKSCINMTQDEKIARKAAREMFACLSNGEDFITSEQLQKRMIEIRNEQPTHKNTHDIRNGLENGEVMNNIETDSDSSSEDTDWSSKSDKNNEKLTEDNLVTAAVSYTNGYLPLVNRVLCLTDPNLNCLDSIPYLQRSILHPFLAVKILYFKLIRMLGVRSYFPFNRTDFQLFLLLIYSLFSIENIFMFLPMVFYYISLVVMLVTTFQVLQSNRDFQDFRVWGRLFLTYSDGSLNPEEAEFQFIRNNLKPCGHFFIALLVNLIIYPLIAKQWIPHSEITVLAFFLMFVTLFTFMMKERKFPDLLLLFSFALNVLAKYPYDTDPVVKQSWRFLDLKIPTLASYIIGHGIEFCLNFKIFFYIFIPIVFMYIAARQKWRGTYKFLIPHCVTLSWLQIVVINSQGATMFGLLRGTLALVGVVLFLPLVGVTTVLLPAVAFAKWFSNNFLFSFMVFIVVASVGLAISWLLSKTKFRRYVSLIQIIFGLSATYVLLNSALENRNLDLYETKVSPEISWENYQNFCHQPAWDSANLAKAQIKCYKIENVRVNWSGYINEVKLRTVKNNYKYIFDKLPNFFNNFLYCYFGKPTEENCDNVTELLKNDCLLFNSIVNKRCSLDEFNIYEFEISIRMQSGIWGKNAEVILLANHLFTNFTVQLRPNDKIWFGGDLSNNAIIGSDGLLGGLKPHVNLKEIGCLACHNMNLTSFKIDSEENVADFKRIIELSYRGLKFLLNILFNPVVVFK